MNSTDCKQYLVSNEEIQSAVRIRAGVDEEDFAEYPQDYRETMSKWVSDGEKISCWKRVMKFTVGSNTEDDCLGDYFPELVGCTARAFWLKGTDHSTFLLVEKDNKIVMVDDISD